MNVSIRPEEATDIVSVREVNEQAFHGGAEARLVDLLRGTAAAISLVATVDDDVVGHILFTPVHVEPSMRRVEESGPASTCDTRVAGLAPMAVRPEWQRMGIGGTLVRAGLEECRRAGYGAVVVVGHPDYYPRFGFMAAHVKGLEYESPIPPEAFMVLELEPDALAGHTGIVRYRPEFAAV